MPSNNTSSLLGRPNERDLSNLNLTGQFTTFIFGTDSHGRYGNTDTQKAFLAHSKALKPDVIIHGGDAFDFDCIRSGAGPEERRSDISEDVDKGLEFLKAMEPDYLLWGNHDDRLLNYIGRASTIEAYRKACELSGDRYERNSKASSKLEEIGAETILHRIYTALDDIGTKTFPYKRGVCYRLGKQKFAHGYFMGDGAVKNMINLYMGNIMFGHLHAFDQYTMPNLEQSVGYCVGGLCDDEKMNYQRNQPRSIKHENGWAYGAVHKRTGNAYICMARKVGGIWFTPDIR